jgi:hypothetical protein
MGIAARPAKGRARAAATASASKKQSVKKKASSGRSVFLVYVRDEAYFRLLTDYTGESERLKVAAFPPLGIQTLAPVLSRSGHKVRMFDTCHPDMRAEQIAAAIEAERPDTVALSFLSVTAYPVMKKLAERLKSSAPWVKIITGGVFASFNADRILEECPYIDYVGVGEGEELLQDYLRNLDNPVAVDGLVWRKGKKVVRNKPRPLIEDLDQYPYPDRTSLPIDYIESLPLDVRRSSLSINSLPYRHHGAVHTSAYTAISRIYHRADGVIVLRSMYSERCSSCTMPVIVRYILPMTIF